MADNLPDELIKEILDLILEVDDTKFADVSHNSQFSSYSGSTSTVLLVCKQWIRVSTLLLYSVVVLRSTAQAQALERTLSANKPLGFFVNKLRIEGGYGPPMYNIINLMPNITHLLMELSIFLGDVAGLRRALPLMNPRHLIIDQRPYREGGLISTATRDIRQAISKSIKKWTCLVRILTLCKFIKNIQAGI